MFVIKKNTLRIMPDDDTLAHICTRVKYLSYCQRNYHLRCHPFPTRNGWHIIQGKCRPVRNLLSVLPVDLAHESQREHEREQERAELEEDDTSNDGSEPEPDDSTDSEAEK